MKKFFKFISLVGLVCGITWVLRDQLLPGPETPTSHPPAFRNSPVPAKPEPSSPPEESEAEPADDLTRLNGIGPVYARKLADLGIDSFGALASADADDLAARGDLARDRVADWIDKAAELA